VTITESGRQLARVLSDYDEAREQGLSIGFRIEGAGILDGDHVREIAIHALNVVSTDPVKPCCVPGGAGAYEYRDGAFRCTTCGRVEEVVD
jgi:hypothetical protein